MHNIVNIVRLGLYLMYVLIYIGFVCFFGDDVTNGFKEISESIAQCSWYRFPLDLQKLLPTIICNAQKTVYVHGYINTKCTRELLKKVISRVNLN